MAYESPLDPDESGAVYRVHCPTCRTNVWADIDEPPVSGDDIIAAHDCPGPVDISEEPAPGAGTQPDVDETTTAPDVEVPVSGALAEPGPSLG